jgi:hypothetical protein
MCTYGFYPEGVIKCMKENGNTIVPSAAFVFPFVGTVIHNEDLTIQYMGKWFDAYTKEIKCMQGVMNIEDEAEVNLLEDMKDYRSKVCGWYTKNVKRADTIIAYNKAFRIKIFRIVCVLMLVLMLVFMGVFVGVWHERAKVAAEVAVATAAANQVARANEVARAVMALFPSC